MHWRNVWINLGRKTNLVRTWTHYQLNLLRYNIQCYISFLKHGQTKQHGKIPFMITAKMRKSLGKLGYQQNDVNILKPAEAAQIIELSIHKQRWRSEKNEDKNQN